MKQTQFSPHYKAKLRHGGALSIRRRKTTRPLSTKKSIHFTLRSNWAKQERSLLKHKIMIQKLIKKWSRYFGISVYEYAICGNHLHFLIRGNKRVQIQNFFRVIAGHIAQNILREYPISERERKLKAGNAPKGVRYVRKFWELLLFTRVLGSWGREFRVVRKYILQNTLEALNIIAYKPRNSDYNTS